MIFGGLKYKGYKKWFVTKFIIPENKIENIQKILNAELIKKYKFLINSEYELIELKLLNFNDKTLSKRNYEYLVTIGFKEFDDEE